MLGNAQEGKQVKVERKKIEVVIPEILVTAFLESSKLKYSFSRLSPSKQRDYAELIGNAKQEATRLRRLDKKYSYNTGWQMFTRQIQEVLTHNYLEVILI